MTVAVIASLAWGDLARAQDVQWHAPTECLSREAWVEELSARVDPETFRAQASKLRVELRIEVIQAGYALALTTELEGVRGERYLEAARCAELTTAAALIVALALDPNAAERSLGVLPASPPETSSERAATPDSDLALAPAPPPEGSARPGTAPAPDVEEPPAITAPPAADGSRLFFARPQAALDLGVLPELALGAALQLGARLGATRLELGGTYLPPQSLSIGERGVVGELRFLAASFGACHALVRGRFELSPCARAELGRIWGRGRNIAGGTSPGGATWLALFAGAQASIGLVDPLRAVLELGVGAPLLAAVFEIDGLGQAHESPDVFGRMSGGVEVSF